MKQIYEKTRFGAVKLHLITICDSILREYISAGYRITVRTLYYQMVARDHIPNTERSYKNLTNLINDARMAGYIDWDVIEDRGRRPIIRARWRDGKQFLESCAPQFHADMWQGQKHRVFVVVEKDALAGVLEDSCHRFDVPLLAAKGYPSVSSVRDLVLKEMMPHMYPQWRSRGSPGKSLPKDERQIIVMLHMGDHDPSGLDMSRDLEKRLRIFGENQFLLLFQRIALNMDQVEEVNPPPNPAKVTDSRFLEYQKEFGDESWELDALAPDYLNNLLTEHIEMHINQDLWKEREDWIADTRANLIINATAFE